MSLKAFSRGYVLNCGCLREIMGDHNLLNSEWKSYVLFVKTVWRVIFASYVGSIYIRVRLSV